jgi:hypothetical protein
MLIPPHSVRCSPRINHGSIHIDDSNEHQQIKHDHFIVYHSYHYPIKHHHIIIHVLDHFPNEHDLGYDDDLGDERHLKHSLEHRNGIGDGVEYRCRQSESVGVAVCL